jgi:predicted glycoside hydrolase/deacetylase ChbG (UPF0249 family)
MLPNPILRELGYSDDDRVVIIHADDIGMCQAGVAALDGLWNAGIISSMAVMAVCPWFPAAAEYCRTHPAVDAGLHFTLTSEWETYRWRPLSACDPASSLLDESGFFPRRSEPVHQRATTSAVRAELRAQMKRAQAAGIDLTHVDSHMITAWHPKCLADYLRIPKLQGIPSFFLRMDPATVQEWGFDPKAAAALSRFGRKFEAQRVPLFDRIFVMPLEHADDRIGTAQRALADLPPGLSYFILHPAVDTPELRAIAPDWKSRVADYQAFTSPELRAFLEHSGIHVIGWRVLRDWMRKRE